MINCSVGAGCGGSVVASRLSETGASVLLLEAGEDAMPASFVPFVGMLLVKNDYSWKYTSKPQTNAVLGNQNNASIYVIINKIEVRRSI